MKKWCLTLALLIAACNAFAAPPPITEAERAACEIVAEHLARGPAAIAEKLDEKSPLRVLRGAAVLSEIEARVGPREGAAWTLTTTAPAYAAQAAVFHVVFPSGLDEIVVFDMTSRDEKWFVDRVRTLAELGTKPIVAQSRATPIENEGSVPSNAPAIPMIVWIAALLAPALAIGGAVMRRDLPRASIIILIASLLSLGGGAFVLLAPHAQSGGAVDLRSGPVTFIEMRHLAPLRHALATGDIRPSATALSPEQQEIAALWRAHASLGRVSAEETKRAIAQAKTFRRSALAVLLQARAAARDANHGSAFGHYRTLRTIEPEHDAFWIEQASVAPDDVTARRTGPKQTRDAMWHYQQFVDRFLVEDADGGRMALQEAWRMRPLSRARVVGSAIGAFMSDPALALLVNLHTPEDKPVTDLDLGRRPMRTPTGARSTATGMFVRVSAGTGHLDVPGGAAIAPEKTTAITARDFERAERDAAVQAIEAVSVPTLGSAAAQRTVESAAEALAENNRWQRIVELTQSITPNNENISTSLIAWRVQALVRTKQLEEARRLASGAGLRRALQHESDASVLLQIAELVGSTGAYEEAMDLVRKAGSLKNAPDIARYLRKFDVRRMLATSTPVQTTPHFQIHAAQGVPVTIAERIGQLLEAELQRLSPRFGITNFTPVRVNVVGWETFSGDLTGSQHVLGMYDGEITIPFGEVPNFRESIVAILTHELTHAIIAQASNDTAPRWFHEGVARRTELVEQQDNIFQVRPTQEFIALELLDPTMNGSIDPVAVSDAYTLAQTFIRYLEDRHGADSINRLIASFRGGANSEEALQAVMKHSFVSIDRDFRTWGTTHAAAFVDKTPWPYKDFYSLGIDPKVREGIRFSRPRTEKRP